MSDDGFGSAPWKNLEAVKFGKDGGIDVPVRANGRDGIEVGLEAVADSERREAGEDRTVVARAHRWWKRFFGG